MAFVTNNLVVCFAAKPALVRVQILTPVAPPSHLVARGVCTTMAVSSLGVRTLESSRWLIQHMWVTLSNIILFMLREVLKHLFCCCMSYMWWVIPTMIESIKRNWTFLNNWEKVETHWPVLQKNKFKVLRHCDENASFMSCINIKIFVNHSAILTFFLHYCKYVCMDL